MVLTSAGLPYQVLSDPPAEAMVIGMVTLFDGEMRGGLGGHFIINHTAMVLLRSLTLDSASEGPINTDRVVAREHNRPTDPAGIVRSMTEETHAPPPPQSALPFGDSRRCVRRPLAGCQRRLMVN